MNVRTFLINNSGTAFSYDNPERITTVDTCCLTGLDTKDGFVKMSMETWKRLELFINVLQNVEIICYEEKIKNLLDKYSDMFGMQEPQDGKTGSE